MIIDSPDALLLGEEWAHDSLGELLDRIERVLRRHILMGEHELVADVLWSMYALYIIFMIANIIMIPLGIVMIRAASTILRAPRSAVLPIIVVCASVGAFATGNNLFAVLTVAAFGVIGYVMEANGYPVAALVLGVVMGTMVEQSFVTSLIKSDGSILPFFDRPVSAILAAITIACIVWPLFFWAYRRFAQPSALRTAP